MRDVYEQAIEEDGIDALMTLWDRLGSIYTAQSINEALADLKEYADRESALWGDADTLPDDEMGIIDSDLRYTQKVETMGALRSSKKARALASGLRIVPVSVPVPVR